MSGWGFPECTVAVLGYDTPTPMIELASARSVLER